MKRILALFSIALLLCCMMSGCSDKGGDVSDTHSTSRKETSVADEKVTEIKESDTQKSDDKVNKVSVSHSFSFKETPVADEKLFNVKGSDTLSIGFDVPKAGFIKMIAYDSTEYDEWPDEITEIYVDFKDENGKILYKKVRITDGFVKKYRFDAGKVIADITFKNRPAKMEEIALSWAFAADSYKPVAVDYKTKSAAPADKNGVARFSFNVAKDSLVRIFPAEACIYESDCKFYVENAKGEKVTGDLSIHGTEWTSRLAFLTKGNYVIVVSGIEAVASCKVKEEKAYDNIQLDNKEGLSVPVTFGFYVLNGGERTAKFTADGSKYLVVEAIGSNTFYDSDQEISVVITDAAGNTVIEEVCDISYRIDISALRGEHSVTISSNGSCVVDISMLTE